ncbi:ATP-grasp domain-containing protein [Streptomyces sp. RB6PN25]|uniref:ATP-grasp domain-containing protein n=1 Tax=Streptomyces humicola TaxID=2953240 RepID=A0ABT1PZR7_9ACTN|nr:ATP-grasp domain-containing protein [Streptomyces humicola]MCQ4082027.1 ATP-grasp domain-containing protein [Streptomyces humicola]
MVRTLSAFEAGPHDAGPRTDGTWRVVEVGDGQVSDLPAGTGPATLLGHLLDAA